MWPPTRLRARLKPTSVRNFLCGVFALHVALMRAPRKPKKQLQIADLRGLTYVLLRPEENRTREILKSRKTLKHDFRYAYVPFPLLGVRRQQRIFTPCVFLLCFCVSYYYY